MTEPWQVERDRFGVMFSGPLEIGEMVEVVPAARLAELEENLRRARNWLVLRDEQIRDLIAECDALRGTTE